jgi:hypothetical protein
VVRRVVFLLLQQFTLPDAVWRRCPDFTISRGTFGGVSGVVALPRGNTAGGHGRGLMLRGVAPKKNDSTRDFDRGPSRSSLHMRIRYP